MDRLVATFNETRAPTSRKYVAEKGIVVPNSSKKYQSFLLALLRFCLRKTTRKFKFSEAFKL